MIDSPIRNPSDDQKKLIDNTYKELTQCFPDEVLDAEGQWVVYTPDHTNPFLKGIYPKRIGIYEGKYKDVCWAAAHIKNFYVGNRYGKVFRYNPPLITPIRDRFDELF